MSGERVWTADQQNAIDFRGGLIVSAAAGSGKTAVLVERVVGMLTDERSPVDADRLLIATFSKAAAKELRERIDRKLSEMLAKDPHNAGLARQQTMLAKASIGTIDSFCLNLLKENANLLDFDGGFRIGDETELGVLSEQALEEVMLGGYESGDKNFLRLTDALSAHDDKPLQDVVVSIYKFIRSFPFPKEWLAQKLEVYKNPDIDKTDWKAVLVNGACDKLRYNSQRLRGLANEVLETELYDYYYDFLINEAEQTESLADKIENSNWDDICAAAGAFYFGRIPAVKKSAVSDMEFKEYIQKERIEISTKKTGNSTAAVLANYFYSDSAEFAEDIRYLYPLIKRLFKMVTDYYDALDRLKKQKGILDYSDLELIAISLLAVKTERGYIQSELAKKLSEQYDEILLDEYQDTNAVQDMIFTLLSKNGSNENEFVVGDVKQSIYGFRKAMPEIFVKRKESAARFDNEHFPALINLSANFRSRHSVTDYINFVFGQLMSKNAGDVDYSAAEKLYAQREFPKYDRANAQLHIITTEKLSRADKKNAQAEYTARLIGDMLDGGYLVESENGIMRPCRAGDFCILMRSVKNAGRYTAALKNTASRRSAKATRGILRKARSRRLSI